jgi:hypothetical protein
MPQGSFVCVVQVQREKNKILSVLVTRYSPGPEGWSWHSRKLFETPARWGTTPPAERILSAQDLRHVLLQFVGTDRWCFPVMDDLLLLLKKRALQEEDVMGRTAASTLLPAVVEVDQQDAHLQSA